MKVLIVAIGSCIVVALAALTGFMFLGSSKELRHKTQAALLRAVPVNATQELKTRGYTLAAPLSCRSMPGATRRSMRVSCAGLTADRKPVQVIAAAERKAKAEYFTILIDGRAMVENVSCLGRDCHRKD